MNPDQLDLARRLAHHEEYKRRAATLYEDDERRQCGSRSVDDEDGYPLPDLTDAATGGILLDMLRPGYLEYFPEEHIWLARKKPAPDAPYHAGKTLAEACARALLAEWGEA